MTRNLLLSFKKIGLGLALLVVMLVMVGNALGATYYSRGNLAPNLTTSWAVNTNGSGTQPTNFTTAGDVFIVQTGHTMTASNNWTIGLAANTTNASTLQINSGGTLNMNTRLLTLASCNFTNAGTFSSTTGGVTISGTLTTNSVDGFSTTGAIVISKTSGTVTLNESVTGGSLSFNTSTNAATILALGSSSVTLAITNAITINRPSSNNDSNILQVGAGTVTCASLSLLGSTGTNRNSDLTISTGTVSVSGNISSAGSNSRIIFSDAGSINVGGSFMTSGTFTPGIGTINYNGGNQTVSNYPYANLTFSGSGIKTISSSSSVSGNLSISPSGTATASIAAGQTINVETLSIGGDGTINGTWGSTTATTATYQDNAFFSPTTGRLNVATSTCTAPSSPTTNGAQICIGYPSPVTLSASGASSGYFYRWYDSASGGNLLKVSSDYTDNTYVTPALGATTNYWVSISSRGRCESSRVQVTATYPSVSPDDQSQAGTNSWIGHVYDGQNFDNYFGILAETEQFDEGFGGDANCFTINSSLGSRQEYTETFSVKYRMNSTSREGLYVVDLGSDDKSRLTVDGDVIYDNWVDQAWTSKPRVLINLTGASSLLYEFTENGGANRVVFQNLTRVLANDLNTNTTQELCMGNSGAAIGGDVFGTLPTGISLSGTGYQWTYSTTPGGTRYEIDLATAATFTPNTSSAPFNSAGTYYVYRNAILVSSNNTGVANYTATNESNAAIITVYALPSAPAGISQIKTYTGIANTTSISATPGAGETIDWYSTASGGSAVSTGSNLYTPAAVNAGTYTFYAEARNTTTGCKSSSRTPVTLTISKATLTVRADNKTVTYGDAVPTLTYAITGFVNGETAATAVTGSPALSTAYTSVTQVASSPVLISILVGNLAANNYSFSLVDGAITISKKALTVTANNQSKCFGDAFSFSGNEFTANGLINGNSVTSVTLTSPGSGAGAAPGSYTIVSSAAAGSGLSNYNISYVNGSLTVNPLPTTGPIIPD